MTQDERREYLIQYLLKEEKEWKKVLDISWRTRYNNYRSLEKIEGTFAGD